MRFKAAIILFGFLSVMTRPLYAEDLAQVAIDPDPIDASDLDKVNQVPNSSTNSDSEVIDASDLDRVNVDPKAPPVAPRARLKKQSQLPPATEKTGKTLEKSLIGGNIAISQWLSSVADGLDLWLAGQRYTKEKNDTSARVTGSVYHSEIKGTATDVAFDLALRLPNVEEYWMLTFTSYDDATENGVAQDYFRTTPREKDYGAGVGLISQLGNVKTRFQPRISFDGFMKISNTLSIGSVIDQKTYKINPKIKLYAEPNVGTGVFFSLNFNKALSRIYSLTIINEGDYRDRPRKLTTTNGVSIGQWFSDRKSLAYNIFVNNQNRPNYQLSSYSFSVAWSHTIYKNILDYQLIPNFVFADEENYRGNPGVNLAVNLRF